MSVDKVGKSIRKKQTQLYDMCHEYLIDNFHKFTPTNKLKVSLAICKQLAPQTVETEITYRKTPDIYLGDRKLEYNIGNRIAEHTEEAGTSAN